ncbi:glycosyltransferase [Pseudosulfitobacter sp. DSM 107133]|uniref:glycosyltransferase n=1 Tax=Pseudosulfitobacter sp. DSM 107133 TaxID=2883100 RepID=UPI000DF3124E|nr:glycosyltransferase [Pseudosulfitobacter sp. DSM 107133]UOA29055.1 hypothetical protein DSM107133_03814 [Pseudosulfitobacter sp. DSM 107133]
MSVSPPPRVTIALCTRNGAAHLGAQLDSYVAQTHGDWDLWVSDDGSDDATRDILETFARNHGAGRTIRIIDGPQQGVAANFLSLLCHPDLPAQPVALSDQDDVWLPEKLALGLRDLGGAAPCLYGAQSVHVDEDLTPIGHSLGGGTAGFGNALVQNIVSGHSAMMNAAALALVRAAGVPGGIPYHDWWLYQLISGAGGHVIVRPDKVLLYRQHGTNTMGSHQGTRALLTRLGQLLGTTFGGWVAANTTALRRCETVLNPSARTVLSDLQSHKRGPARLRVFRRHGITRQGRLGTAALYLAVLLGRV